MCGLIGWISRNRTASVERARQYVYDQYEEQHLRGQKGFGIVEIDDDGIVNVLRATEPIKMQLDLRESETRHLFLHHRSPTSTENSLDQTHPIEIAHEELAYTWLVMHNGTISNSRELKVKHEALGYVYLTEYKKSYSAHYESTEFNDSESFAIELARYLEGLTKELACRGGISFMAIAVDDKDRVQRVFIGTNGYGGLKIADHKYAFSFASEELGGKDIADNRALMFSALYSEDKKRKDLLLGFSEPVEFDLKFEAIVSPYSRSIKDDKEQETNRKAGFGTPRTTVNTKEEDVTFSSFGDIVDFVVKSPVADIFEDTESADNDAVATFNLVDFNRAITAGQIKEAEDIYEGYRKELVSWLDADTVVEEAVEPREISIPDNPTSQDVLDGYKELSKRRMQSVAREFVPLFKVCSYAECLITLAHQYKVELTNPKPKKTVSQKIDEADPDKALDEQIDRDVAEVFPGTGQNLLPAGPVMKDAEYKEVHTPAQDMGHEADTALQALKESAESMDPADVYREADNVGDLLRQSSELALIEYLSKVQAVAAEEGLPIKIPFYTVRIKDEISRIERKFKTLGEIVGATHNRENLDEYRLPLSG